MNDIVHVGLHKTGSTWLQRAVFPSCSNRYYLDDRHRRYARHIVRPGELWSERVREMLDAHEEGVLWSCEDLGGLLQGADERRQIAERLQLVLRDPGVIVVVRSQAQLIPSLYAQYVKLGGTGTFATFLRGECRGFELDLHSFDYYGLIDILVSRFGRSRVLILPYEGLVRDQAAFLARLSAFCGETFKVLGTEVLNPSPSAAGVTALRAWNRAFRRTRFNPSPVLALPGGSRVRHFVQRNIRVGPSVHERWGAAAEAVSLRYARSNSMLQELMDDDLGALGYPI